MSEHCRRSTRIQKRELTTGSATPKKLKKNASDDQDSFFDLQNDAFREELNNIEINSEKPTELFSENDVDGRNMYPVITNNFKKHAMIEKAAMCREKQDNFPIKKDLRVSLTKVSSNKIPSESWNVKCHSNQKENKRLPNVASDESEFDEASNESSHECDVSSENENSDSDHKQNENNKKYRVARKEEKKSPMPLRNRKLKTVKDYNFKTEEYFATQSEKSVTSNHTLNRLKNRHIDEEKLQQLLANSNHISKAHQKQIKIMSETLQQRYIEWLHIMEEGFTILLYGLGSKRLLINSFYKQMIPDDPTLIINGFFPSLTLKEILDSIIVDLLGLETVTNQNECYDIIEKTMKTHPNDRIYLLIHNIDGGMLRPNKVQDMLSRLASIPNIHVLASIDHINAPLIWDNVKRSRYNFYWMDATTFLPYEAETSYESSLLVQKSGALALLSLQNVFASLTSNAKAIYILLVKYQIENSGNNYPGMAFKDLYRAAREGFFVSSDQALRAQLIEFVDHKLVKIKRNVDGVEYLIIPLEDVLLNQFLEQHEPS